MSPDPRRYSPAVARNRDPILAVLRRVLPAHGLVLEIASGSGEHAAHFAAALPALTFQPSDRDDAMFASIAAHAAGRDNVRPPLVLNVTATQWPVQQADAILCINMVHISPWRATEGLIAGASRTLRSGGVLYLYGPYMIDGRHTADSNEAFDASLRAQDPEWGVRDLGAVMALATQHEFSLEDTVPMPANNFSVVLRAR